MMEGRAVQKLVSISWFEINFRLQCCVVIVCVLEDGGVKEVNLSIINV